MISEMKWPVLVIGNCILIFLMQLINDALGPYTIHLCPFALFIFIPLVTLPFAAGLASVIATGLILDASIMLVPGTTTIILAVVYTACFWFRGQFKTYSAWHNMLILQSGNAIIVAFLSVFINTSNHISAYYWISIVINLVFSQILLLFISPWFLTLQNSLLSMLCSKLKTPEVQTQVENLAVEAS